MKNRNLHLIRNKELYLKFLEFALFNDEYIIHLLALSQLDEDNYRFAGSLNYFKSDLKSNSEYFKNQYNNKLKY